MELPDLNLLLGILPEIPPTLSQGQVATQITAEILPVITQYKYKGPVNAVGGVAWSGGFLNYC